MLLVSGVTRANAMMVVVRNQRPAIIALLLDDYSSCSLLPSRSLFLYEIGTNATMLAVAAVKT
jgi:hypothetical protein